MLKGETWYVEKKLTQIDSSELTSSTLIGKKNSIRTINPNRILLYWNMREWRNLRKKFSFRSK